jgi:hypothetical protein
MSEYKEALQRLELQGHSERENINRNFHQCNYGIQRDYRKKRFYEETQAKLFRYNIPQTIYIHREDYNFHNGKYHFKFNTDFSLSNFIKKTIQIRDIHLKPKFVRDADYDLECYLTFRCHYQQSIQVPHPNPKDPNIYNHIPYFQPNGPVGQYDIITINVKSFAHPIGARWQNFVRQNGVNPITIYRANKTFQNVETMHSHEYNPIYFANVINKILHKSVHEQIPELFKRIDFNFYYDEEKMRLTLKMIFKGLFITFNPHTDFMNVFLSPALYELLGWKDDYDFLTENGMNFNWQENTTYNHLTGDTTAIWYINNPVYDINNFSVCASFSLWDQFSRIGRIDESHDYLNKEYPYTGGDDFEIWVSKSSGEPVRENLFEGSITLELSIEKSL